MGRWLEGRREGDGFLAAGVAAGAAVTGASSGLVWLLGAEEAGKGGGSLTRAAAAVPAAVADMAVEATEATKAEVGMELEVK